MSASKMAVATLLRLADADLRDAAVLSTGRNPVNAPALAVQAVTRLVRATSVTEVGWTAGCDDVGIAAIPDENPLKCDIGALLERLPSSGPPMPREDGQPPPPPDREALHRGIDAAKVLLRNLAERFVVDLAGDGAAGLAEPIRPDPAPEMPQPPEPEQQVAEEPSAPQTDRRKATRGGSAKAARELPVDRTHVPPKAPLIVGRARQAVERPPAAEPHELAGRATIASRPGPNTMTSSAFWSLMDRWHVADLDALKLIGHPGGLTKKNTRPRFKLVGGEVPAFFGLQEIDTALVPLDLDPGRWLHEPNGDGPFAGLSPLAFLMKAQLEGIRTALRFLLRSGLKMSVSS